MRISVPSHDSLGEPFDCSTREDWLVGRGGGSNVKRRHARTCPKDDKTCQARAATPVQATLSAIKRWPMAAATPCLSRQHDRRLVRPSWKRVVPCVPTRRRCKMTRPGRNDPLLGPCSCRRYCGPGYRKDGRFVVVRPGLQQKAAKSGSV
jgi:hypothetical protein